jgi:phospholipid/cholesterol/gamma-HCH transport system permease protein
MPRDWIRSHVIGFFDTAGDLGLFGGRALREAFRPPFEFSEFLEQIVQVGWRSTPLVAACGFAVGLVLSLQTRASLVRFGAQAMIPEVTALALVRDMGPLLVGLLVAGRVGAGIGAELAGMRVTEQIDALESLAIDSFKYLVVTRVLACILAMPILTTISNFSGLVGGFVGETFESHISFHQYLVHDFDDMDWSDYIPPTAKTVVFGFIIGTVSCFLGYTAKGGAAGVGQASTRSVVLSSLLMILADVILVKVIFFWFPQSV